MLYTKAPSTYILKVKRVVLKTQFSYAKSLSMIPEFVTVIEDCQLVSSVPTKSPRVT